MKYIYCPAQIKQALQAAKLDLRVLLDTSKLANILSPEDVAFYLHLNLDLKGLVPDEITQSLSNAVIDQKSGRQIFAQDHSASKEITRVLNDYSLNANAPALALDNMTLFCHPMDENVILFTHVPLEEGQASSSTPHGLCALFDRLIEQLTTFMSFPEVARLPVMAGFLRATQAMTA